MHVEEIAVNETASETDGVQAAVVDRRAAATDRPGRERLVTCFVVRADGEAAR